MAIACIFIENCQIVLLDILSEGVLYGLNIIELNILFK